MAIRQRLLRTSEDRVTPEIEITHDFEPPEQHLGVAFELSG